MACGSGVVDNAACILIQNNCDLDFDVAYFSNSLH